MAAMGSHRAKRQPASRRRGKRFLIPLIVGVVTFGAVTAFAATLTVNSKSLGSGNATVTSCNASAAVTYNTSYSATLPGYKVTTAPVTSAVACATLSHKVTLTGASNASLGEVSGTLDASGNASPDFSSSNIAASLVTGVSVVITG
jgi:flagellar basal body-associated protein FliL